MNRLRVDYKQVSTKGCEQRINLAYSLLFDKIAEELTKARGLAKYGKESLNLIKL